MFDFSKITDWIKLSPFYLLALSLLTGILLFSPEEYLQTLGLTPLLGNYKIWIGLIFLFSTVFLVTHLLNLLVSPLQTKIKEYQLLRKRKKKLEDLSQEEKEILKAFISEETKTCPLSSRSGIVNGLAAKKIITRASNIGYAGYSFTFDYNIRPWAWKYLNENPELLE